MGGGLWLEHKLVKDRWIRCVFSLLEVRRCVLLVPDGINLNVQMVYMWLASV